MTVSSSRYLRHSKNILTARRILAYTVMGILSALCLIWFYILFVNSTRSKGAIQQGFSWLPGPHLFDNIQNCLETNDISLIRGMLNSLIVATSGSLLSVYFSALTAYAIHVYRFRFRNAFYRFILLIMMIPQQVSTLGFYDMIFKMRLVNSWIPLILPTIASPMTFFFIIQYMEGSLPLDIIEAARIDGSSEFMTFNRIILPILKPALAVEMIFSFVASWNNYFIPSLILTDNRLRTLPVIIGILRSASWVMLDISKIYTTVAMSILPVIVVYLLLSKYIIRGIAIGSVKG